MHEVIVSMENITKTFPGIKALDNVQFHLRAGTVEALLGENGAGKSTLMKILSGVYTRDSGKLEIFGKQYDDLTPKTAQQAGVAIIHQELNMCRHLSVAENMFLGREKTRGLALNNGQMEREARESLQFEHVTYKEKDKVLLQDFDLNIFEGEIMEHPWETMIFPHMSVLDNLCLCMDHRVPQVWRAGNIRKSIRKTIEEQMGEGICGRRISELSDKERSELVYTRILLQKPKIVFCIQPFKGEDLPHRLLIWEMQKRLLDRGIAVVIMAVNMADALSLADRVIRIDRDTKVEEYEREDFHKLPPTVPWYFMYQEADGLWMEGEVP